MPKSRKRSGANRRRIVPTPPMIVSRGLMDEALEIRERQIVNAFSGGWAREEHFDDLADMRDVITLAAAHKQDETTLKVCRLMLEVMNNIRARYAKTGRMGVTGEELKLLQVFCTAYRDWWMRQPVGLYESACDALSRARAAQAAASQ